MSRWSFRTFLALALLAPAAVAQDGGTETLDGVFERTEQFMIGIDRPEQFRNVGADRQYMGKIAAEIEAYLRQNFGVEVEAGLDLATVEGPTSSECCDGEEYPGAALFTCVDAKQVQRLQLQFHHTDPETCSRALLTYHPEGGEQGLLTLEFEPKTYAEFRVFCNKIDRDVKAEMEKMFGK